MPPLSAVRVSNVKFSPKTIPVALFVGGTSGIGKAMAEDFARYTRGNAHILLCGRNRTAAESIIASFPKSSNMYTNDTVPSRNGPLHEFIHCNALLMKNVHATTSELLTRLPKINYLVLSPGFLWVKGRTETEEGIDKKLALNYYARWKFIWDLMPLLNKAHEAGEDAKVMSILAAGTGGPIDLDDLGLFKTYSIYNAAMATPTYTDLMFESFSSQNPGVSFTHMYPGFVRTPILSNFFRNPILRAANYGLYLSTAWMMYDVHECSEYMLYALFQREGAQDLIPGNGGVFRKGAQGDDIGLNGYYSTDEARRRLWEHTVATMDKALSTAS